MSLVSYISVAVPLRLIHWFCCQKTLYIFSNNILEVRAAIFYLILLTRRRFFRLVFRRSESYYYLLANLIIWMLCQAFALLGCLILYFFLFSRKYYSHVGNWTWTLGVRVPDPDHWTTWEKHYFIFSRNVSI